MQKKQKRILIFSILLGVLLIVGISFAYSSSHYWTMSPRYYNYLASIAREFSANSNGYAGNNNFGVTNIFGVRPVINLASNVKIESGIGTANDPFVVKVA